MANQDRLGTVIAGRYRIDEVIGSGGGGRVYGAVHLITQRAVAVKILTASASDDVRVRRFMIEAQAAARLNHRNVVEVLDMGEEEDGAIYLVLERLKGESLQERLDTCTALDADETFSLLIPIMDAVAVAHRAGIIHRDLKPGNIFIHREDDRHIVSKLLDFGIAKFIDFDREITVVGTRLGTLRYMSPEQARGEKKIGPPTDVWSMAVVLYRCLTGKPPFNGPDANAIVAAIVSGEFAPLHATTLVSSRVAKVIERALSPSQTARYSEMGAFVEALVEARNAAAQIDLEDTIQLAPKSLPLRRVRLAVAALLLLLVVAGLIVRGPRRAPAVQPAIGATSTSSNIVGGAAEAREVPVTIPEPKIETAAESSAVKRARPIARSKSAKSPVKRVNADAGVASGQETDAAGIIREW